MVSASIAAIRAGSSVNRHSALGGQSLSSIVAFAAHPIRTLAVLLNGAQLGFLSSVMRTRGSDLLSGDPAQRGVRAGLCRERTTSRGCGVREWRASSARWARDEWTTKRTVLQRHGMPPAQDRSRQRSPWGPLLDQSWPVISSPSNPSHSEPSVRCPWMMLGFLPDSGQWVKPTGCENRDAAVTFIPYYGSATYRARKSFWEGIQRVTIHSTMNRPAASRTGLRVQSGLVGYAACVPRKYSWAACRAMRMSRCIHAIGLAPLPSIPPTRKREAITRFRLPGGLSEGRSGGTGFVFPEGARSLRGVLYLRHHAWRV